MIDPAAERDERVMSLAAEALKTPLSLRDRFLKTECQTDPDLYREVSEIVTWEERMGSFLTRPLIEFIDPDALDKVFEPGETVAGRFEILRAVGEGGMGVVYEAYDNKRKQRIAIKCAKPGFARLLSPELERAINVRHPNVCLVNDIHQAQTDFGPLDFLTMEFLDGETLADRLERGPLNEAEAREITRQLCASVAEAHRSNVLHRDLKPANVILCKKTDGGTRAVITDFGLAADSSIAVLELMGGTPAYMAPELWQGGKTSRASDVFSLGVILYEMVTGQRPFPQKTENRQAEHHQAENHQAEKGNAFAPMPPSKLVKGLPSRWDAAILPCLKADPEERSTAEEVLETLERKPLYRRPAVWATLALAVVLGAAAEPKIREWIEPPPYTLVVLPAEGAAGDLGQRSQAILDEVTARLRHEQMGKATMAVIPPEKALAKGVKTPEDAARVFGATHALAVKVQPEANGVSADGAVIDLHTMAHVRDYSGHFAANDLDDLSSGLTGTVGWALHLRRARPVENVTSAAAANYKNGLNDLEREPADFASAIPEFAQAARLDPHSPLPLAGLAAAYSRKFQYQRDEGSRSEAQLWLARAEQLDADAGRVRLASGLLHLIQGDNPKALADYQRVEEIEPNNEEALIGLGFAYELQHILDKAQIDYRRAMAAAPKDAKPYTYMGALYFNDGHYAEAAEMFKQAMSRAPNDATVYGSLAAAYIAQGKDSEADKVFDHAPPGPATANLLNNRGAQLAFHHRDAEAVPYYQKAINQDPNRSYYWINLGDSYRRLNHPIDARQAYQNGLKAAQPHVISNQNSPSARAFLAYLQARLGFKDQARAEIAAAMSSPARDDQVILTAVETYETLGERPRSLEAAALATPPTRQEINLHPDLAGLQQDSRFRMLLAQNK